MDQSTIIHSRNVSKPGSSQISCAQNKDIPRYAESNVSSRYALKAPKVFLLHFPMKRLAKLLRPKAFTLFPVLCYFCCLHRRLYCLLDPSSAHGALSVLRRDSKISFVFVSGVHQYMYDTLNALNCSNGFPGVLRSTSEII